MEETDLQEYEIEFEDDPDAVDDTGKDLSAGLNVRETETPSTEAPQTDSSPDELSRLRADNQELRDQSIRARADFENFRKRQEREKADFRKYALADVVRDLLPVLDNFDRALASDSSSGDFHRGVELIHKQLSDLLQKFGVRAVDPEGEMFDPTMHEAIVSDEGSSAPANTITAVLQKGYFLNDRLIRPAMVRVASGAGAALSVDGESAS